MPGQASPAQPKHSFPGLQKTFSQRGEIEQDVHTYISHTGDPSDRPSKGHCPCSMVSVTGESLLGYLPSPRTGVAQLCWPQSMEDARRGVSRQDCARRCGEEPGTSQGHMALHPPALPPCFSSRWLSGSLCVLCLCVLLCVLRRRDSECPASWWEWWLLTPFFPTDRHW